MKPLSIELLVMPRVEAPDVCLACQQPFTQHNPKRENICLRCVTWGKCWTCGKDPDERHDHAPSSKT